MSETPVPSDFRVTWSHSSLDTFRICPRKYYHEKISKTVPWETNAAASWGVDVHKALEDFSNDATPLPSNMVQYKWGADFVLKLRAVTAELHAETKFAVTHNGDRCGFDAPDYYGRGITDIYAIEHGGRAAIVGDYKTGKYYGPTLQPVSNAYLIFKNAPDIDRIRTRFIYFKEAKIVSDEFLRENIERDFAPVQGLIDQLETAVSYRNFPAKRNFLCRSFCGELSCPHNGRGR